jgi:cellulose synthase/poly-beta-1,6-N-acetylglucosamine synthase-like glycosyltransferase
MKTDIEIPLGKRKFKYRLLEMLPAMISYGMLALMVVLSIVNTTIAAIYLFLIVVSLLVKAVGMAYRTVQGRRVLDKAQKVNWHQRLLELETPKEAYLNYQTKVISDDDEFKLSRHIHNLSMLTKEDSKDEFPLPSQIYNAVVIAAYNESFDVIAPTIQTVINTSYDKDRIILILAYEARGGEAMKKTALKLQKRFSKEFFSFQLVEHPADIPNEVQGKGGNITYAGKFLQKWLQKRKIDPRNVIVTTLDSDNKPHKTYFDYLTYEFIVNRDRQNLSYQPICLFTSNIWDAPAPMRVIATGNSFWNIISSLRPHTLRNFASHSQPMKALKDMNFWSTRTVVEDGHQYWRSYFFFKGKYGVIPIYVPIYQDAVLSDTYIKTLKAQFKQLKRWDYGASDVPYVGVRLFTRKREVPFWRTLLMFINLVDGHVTLAAVAVLVAIGGWIPLLINGSGAKYSVVANQLPETIGYIQTIAMIGILITLFCFF